MKIFESANEKMQNANEKMQINFQFLFSLYPKYPKMFVTFPLNFQFKKGIYFPLFLKYVNYM